MLRDALAIDSLNSRVQYEAALTQWQLGERRSGDRMAATAIAGGYPTRLGAGFSVPP
jgi:hypothetical protein